MYLRLSIALLILFALFPASLNSATPSKNLTGEKQQDGRIPPNKTTKAAQAQAEREKKEQETREEAARNKKIADERLDDERADRKKQVEINIDIAYFTKVLAYVGGAQAIVAFLTVVLALLTWFVTNKAANAARDAAVSARIAADTAKDQAAAMKERERAWIMVKPENPTGFPKPDSTFPFTFKFIWTAKNVGYTAGFLERVRPKAELRDYPLSAEPPRIKPGQPLARFIIPANGSHGSEIKKRITAEEFEKLASGKKCIVFYGFIEYRHIFSQPDAEPRYTYFCSYWYSTKNGQGWKFAPIGPPKWINYT
jgi:hypothetical protein